MNTGLIARIDDVVNFNKSYSDKAIKLDDLLTDCKARIERLEQDVRITSESNARIHALAHEQLEKNERLTAELSKAREYVPFTDAEWQEQYRIGEGLFGDTPYSSEKFAESRAIKRANLTVKESNNEQK